MMKWIQINAFVVFLAMLGISCNAYAGDLYIPRTSIHFKCKFPDGSYTEYQEKEKWYFWAEVLPHAQTRGYLKSMMQYVDTKGKSYPYVGTEDTRCEGVGKRNGRVFWGDGFENLEGQFVHFNKANQITGVESPRWENFPQNRPLDTPDDRERFINLHRTEGVYIRPGKIIQMESSKMLLFEQAFVRFDADDSISSRVLYVYQSISPDYGKTWSTPVITKDAKLFEIGRLLTEQSWAAKVEMLTPHK